MPPKVSKDCIHTFPPGKIKQCVQAHPEILKVTPASSADGTEDGNQVDFNNNTPDVETISGQHSLLRKSSSEAALLTRRPPPDEIKDTNRQSLFPSIISNGKSVALFFFKKADLSVGGAPSDGPRREEVLLNESRRLVSSISP